MEGAYDLTILLKFIFAGFVILMGLYALWKSRIFSLIAVEIGLTVAMVRTGFLLNGAGWAVGVLVVGATFFVWCLLRHNARWKSSQQ